MSTTLTPNGTGAGTAPDSRQWVAPETYEPAPKGAGWIVYAATIFLIAACMNIIWGIAAVSNSKFFVGNAQYILSDLNTWGWVVIGLGAIEFLVAWSVWRGGSFGRWFGMFVAGVAALIAMVTIPAYPFWSLALFAMYLLVIYGLAAYGGKRELTG